MSLPCRFRRKRSVDWRGKVTPPAPSDIGSPSAFGKAEPGLGAGTGAVLITRIAVSARYLTAKLDPELWKISCDPLLRLRYGFIIEHGLGLGKMPDTAVAPWTVIGNAWTPQALTLG